MAQERRPPLATPPKGRRSQDDQLLAEVDHVLDHIDDVLQEEPTMADKTPNQTSQSQQTGAEGQQVGSAGGDVRQMTVGQLMDVAVQNNMDVTALNDLVGQIQTQIGQQQNPPPEPTS